MAWSNVTQRRSTCPGAGLRCERGRVVAAGVDGFTFTVASKLRRVFSGHGIMIADGIVAYPATGIVSSGAVSFTRNGPIFTSADSCDYVLWGI